MPRYTITARGGLLGRGGLKPEGSVVEMSEKDAASLPVGSVSLVVEPPPAIPPVAPVVSAPAVTPPAVEAPKGRKGNKP